MLHRFFLDVSCPACVGRNFKYDATQLEYFVETSDVVRIRYSDLEKWQAQEQVSEIGELASEPLMPGVEDVKPDALPAEPSMVNHPAEVKEGLSKFTQNLHERASLMTSWVADLEANRNSEPSAREEKFLG